MSNKKNYIYVIGYPKSGTTWMTRIIAMATRNMILEKKNENVEIASDINQYISKESLGKYIITKTHFIPDQLKNEAVEVEGKIKIIYMVRDFRDVCVSSFYYFGGDAQRWFLKRFNFLKGIDRLLNEYNMHKFTSLLMAGQKSIKTNWKNHVRLWLDEESRNKSDLCIVRYEDLHDNPKIILKHIIEKLNLKNVDNNDIENAIFFNTFENTKRRLKKDPSKNTRIRNINNRHLRSGKYGDWKKYLSKITINKINGEFGDILVKLGYEI